MEIVDIEEAQRSMDDLIDAARAGQEIVISMDGVPVARLEPVVDPSKPLPDPEGP